MIFNSLSLYISNYHNDTLTHNVCQNTGKQWKVFKEKNFPLLIWKGQWPMHNWKKIFNYLLFSCVAHSSRTFFREKDKAIGNSEYRKKQK